MINYKNVKDIKTEVRDGKAWRIIIFKDGSKQEKMVDDSTISRIVADIEGSLKVVSGDKTTNKQK